jgi:hypothetical protein
MRESVQSCTVRRKNLCLAQDSYSVEVSLPDLTKIIRPHALVENPIGINHEGLG